MNIGQVVSHRLASPLRWCFRALVLAGTIGLTSTTVAQDLPPPTVAQMWQVIQTQQAEIAELRGIVEELRSETANPNNSPEAMGLTSPSSPATVNRQANEIERLRADLDIANQRIDATAGMIEASAASQETSGDGWWQRTSLGGYGELHYNGGKKDEIDFHRFVLFVGHRFNDWISLSSEIEFEHVATDRAGEVELEQAFLSFDLTEGLGLRFGETDRHALDTGVILVPTGILNKTHEPPTFFGVERNEVEANIIPTTWWEGGVNLHGNFGEGFRYSLAFHSGLETPIAGGNAFKIRNGRNKVSKASAEDPAVTAQLIWAGVPGVEIGVSAQHQADITQGALDVEAWLLEAHVDIRRGPFGLRALYARWDLKGPEPKLIGRDAQYGWYIEPSWRFPAGSGEIGVFARYAEWNNEGGLKGVDREFDQVRLGFNYWPHPDVVIKMDYQFDDAPEGESEDDRINLGVGYQF